MRQVDTLIIGGGIAGLSAAARLARHGETVVLEAESQPGYHASGRSVTFCHFGLGDGLVKALTAVSRETFAAPISEGETPVAHRHPALHIARADQAAEVDALEKVHRALSPDYHRLSGKEAAKIVPLRTGGEAATAFALLDPNGFKLDPHAMLQRHIAALREAGGTLVTDARATAIRRDGGRWVVDTMDESYATTRLINAAGAWADHVAAMAGVAPIGIEPRRRTVISFDGPGDTDVSAWPFTKTIGEGFYFLPEGTGRLLASPQDETVSEPCDASPEEIDIATIAWRIEEATTMTVPRIAHRWAGLRSFAPDERPVVGYDPDAPGFFWLAGQGGFGLQTSPALSLAAEALAMELEWPENLKRGGIGMQDLEPKRLRERRSA